MKRTTTVTAPHAAKEETLRHFARLGAPLRLKELDAMDRATAKERSMIHRLFPMLRMATPVTVGHGSANDIDLRHGNTIAAALRRATKVDTPVVHKRKKHTKASKAAIGRAVRASWKRRHAETTAKTAKESK